MKEIVLTDANDQEFTVSLNDKQCTFRFRFMTMLNRWVFDLDIDGVQVLNGRIMYLRIDLLRSLGLGIGGLVAWDYTDEGSEPGRNEVPARQVRIFSIQDEEVAAIQAGTL